MKVLLILGMLLTPFSTGVNSGFPVISFGLPFLLLAAFLSFLSPAGLSLNLPRRTIPPVLCGAVVVAAILFFAFASVHPDKSLARVAPNVISFLVVLRALSIYRDDGLKLFDLAVKLLMISGAVMSLYYLINLGFMIRTFGAYEVMKDRGVNGLASLPWGASNMISAALLFPHVACHIRQHRNGGKMPAIVITLILCTTLATISRTGMIVHAAMLIAGCLITRNYRYLAVGLCSGFLLITMFALVAPDSFEFLVEARFNPERDLSNGRLDSFANKITYIAGNIMTPVGYYGSLFVFDGLTSHNFMLTVLLEQGLVGIFAVLAFLCACMLALYRQRNLNNAERAVRRILTAGALLSFLNLQVEDANFSQPYIIYFWVMFLITMAFVASLKPQVRSTTQSNHTRYAHA